jgi:sigma-B regulation protein RsbU (phosphoserine phosphatase)
VETFKKTPTAEITLENFQREQLRTILKLTQAINDNIHAPDLYHQFFQILKNQLGTDQVGIYKFDQTWQKELLETNGKPAPSLRQIENFVKDFSTFESPKSLEINFLEGFTHVIPVYHKFQILAIILIGESQLLSILKPKEILEYIQILANIIIVAIENKRLYKREVEKKQLDKDIDLASKIQNMLIPNNLPKNKLYEFSGLYLPFKGIGGDYYDVIHINKNEFLFCIADISGKGIAAALVMANLQASLSALVGLNLNPIDMWKRLNRKIYSITKGDSFITLFAAKYNILTRTLEYLNAGHNPPVLISADGKQKFLKTGCTLLGAFEELPKIELGQEIIGSNTTILCYTDGLTELENNDLEQYGMDRLSKFCQKNHKYGTDIFIKILHEDISKFKENRLFNDDISVLACKFL